MEVNEPEAGLELKLSIVVAYYGIYTIFQIIDSYILCREIENRNRYIIFFSYLCEAVQMAS